MTVKTTPPGGLGGRCAVLRQDCQHSGCTDAPSLQGQTVIGDQHACPDLIDGVLSQDGLRGVQDILRRSGGPQTRSMPGQHGSTIDMAANQLRAGESPGASGARHPSGDSNRKENQEAGRHPVRGQHQPVGRPGRNDNDQTVMEKGQRSINY